MERWDDLWNIESGNLVAWCDSLPIAVDNLTRAAAMRPMPSWFESMGLITEHAEGEALYALAVAASPQFRKEEAIQGKEVGESPSRFDDAPRSRLTTPAILAIRIAGVGKPRRENGVTLTPRHRYFPAIPPCRASHR